MSPAMSPAVDPALAGRGRKPPAVLFAAATLALALGCSGPLAVTDGGLAGRGDGGLFVDAGQLDDPFQRPCSSDRECASGVCGIAGSGQCCAQRCDTVDPLCGATGCDREGRCVYPDPTVGCGQLCQDGQLAVRTCNGGGLCTTGVATSCPDLQGCASGNTACARSCLDSSACAADAYCDSQGRCRPRQQYGSCGADESCQSGICGTGGSGACCQVDCNTADPTCGASGCDPGTGACLFPAAGTPCGLASCSGHTLTRAACDGQRGLCSQTVSQPCPEFFTCSLNGLACETSCRSNADCAPGASCALDGKVCCAALPSKTLQVDVANGRDQDCCGAGAGPAACATLSYAMQQINAGALAGVEIQLVGNPVAPPEVFPIQLGWGVKIVAPGVVFSPPPVVTSSSLVVQTIFSAQRYPGEADAGLTLPVGLAGAPGNLLTLQASYAAGLAPGDIFTAGPGTAVDLEAGDSALTLSEVQLVATAQPAVSLGNDVIYPPTYQPGYLVKLAGHSALTLGPGPVNFRVNGSQYASSTAIRCAGSGSAVADLGGSGPVLYINSAQYSTGLEVRDGCAVALAQGPVIGGPCSLAAAYNDSDVLVQGGSSVALGSQPLPAQLSCASKGFDVESGTATLQLVGSATQCGCAGVYLGGGTSFAGAGLQLTHDTVGLWLAAALSSVSLGSGANFSCNGYSSNNAPNTTCLSEASQGARPALAGAGVYVGAAPLSGTLSLQGATWNDFAGVSTDVYTCDTSPAGAGGTVFDHCSCAGACATAPPPSGPLAALPDAVDVVLNRAIPVVLDTSGGADAGACF